MKAVDDKDVDLVIIGLRSFEGHEDAPSSLGGRFIDFVKSYLGTRKTKVNFGDFSLREDLLADICRGVIGEAKVLLVKPITTMNKSGECVSRLVELGLSADKMVVVFDDISIKPGKHKIVAKPSSSAGHQGVLSVERIIGNGFIKLKIGVGRILGDVDEFFTNPHPSIDVIVGIFEGSFNSIISLKKISALISSHRDVNSLFKDFVDYLRDAGREDEVRLRKLDGIARFPVFISREVVQVFQKRLGALVRILIEVNKRYSMEVVEGNFESELVALLETGISEELLPLVRASSFDPNHIRVDTHLCANNGTGTTIPKIIEINMAPGGLILERTAREFFGGLSFLARHNLGVSQQKPLSQLIVEHALNPKFGSIEKPCVAFVSRVGPHSIRSCVNQDVARFFDPNVVALQDCELDSFVFDQARNGLFYGDNRVDIVSVKTNYGTNGRAEAVAKEPIIEAVRRGVVSIFPSPRNLIFVSKGFLAALADPRKRKILGVSDSVWKKISQHIIWAREWDSEVRDTVGTFVKEGVEFVLKPFFGSGGRGVKIVRNSESFADIARRIKETPYIAQLSVQPSNILEEALSYDIGWIFYTDSSGRITELFLYTRVFPSGNKLSLNSPGSGDSAVIQI